KAKKPVANRDLWEPLIGAVRARGDVTFRWVKGHSDDVTNDLVDRLAVEAAMTQRGRSGTGLPPDLGPPDTPAARGRARARGGAAATGAEPDLPGHRVVVAGHRPPEPGGSDPNPTADAVRDRLAAILGAKRELHPDLVVLTGLGLGAEQLGAEAAARVGAPYVAVLPYPEQDAVWPRASRDHYGKLLSAAADQILMQQAVPDSKQKAGAALARRDAWLARH